MSLAVKEILNIGCRQLEECGFADAAIDSKLLYCHLMNVTNTQLILEYQKILPDALCDEYFKLLDIRSSGVPLQHITGVQDFMGLEFMVNEHVLIPRQDTETLVESVIVALHEFKDPDVLDLCAGSGAIGLSIQSLLPSANVTLSDVSKDALEVVRRNAHELNLDVDIRHGDLFKAVGRDTFDLIASNPPYIPRGDLSALQREVLREPMLALDGGQDGLDIYRRIAQEAGAHLNPGGFLYLEVGIGEVEPVLTLATQNIQCAQAGVFNDLNGIPRVVWARSV